MDIADCNGVPFRRLLVSEERFSDFATFRGFPDLKTFVSRSSASLFSVTFADHLRGFFCVFFAVFLAGFFRVADFAIRCRLCVRLPEKSKAIPLRVMAFENKGVTSAPLHIRRSLHRMIEIKFTFRFFLHGTL